VRVSVSDKDFCLVFDDGWVVGITFVFDKGRNVDLEIDMVGNVLNLSQPVAFDDPALELWDLVRGLLASEVTDDEPSVGDFAKSWLSRVVRAAWTRFGAAVGLGCSCAIESGQTPVKIDA
jgi:hypothetical protein